MKAAPTNPLNTMTNTHTGGCLCGQINYQFSSEPIAAVHCHCKDCQKATGSGFATVFGLAESDVEIDGLAQLGTFTLTAESGQKVSRQFCTQCGSPLFTLAENNPEFIWIKAGSLDDSNWLIPTYSCWTHSAANWAPPDTTLNQHSKNP